MNTGGRSIAVEARNGSGEPFELVNEFGLFDGAGAFQRHVWVDPAKRPQALPGVCVLAPGEARSAEVFVPLELADGDDGTMYIPSFAGPFQHDCTSCGRDHQEFLARAMWQPVLVRRDAAASDS